MKKRHNSAPWAPDEASPYLDESSRRAESESEEHFVRKAHFSEHFSVKKRIFPSKKKSQNWVEIKFQRNIWGQLDVRTRMRASKSWNFDLEKPIKPIKMDSCVIFADHCSWEHYSKAQFLVARRQHPWLLGIASAQASPPFLHRKLLQRLAS